MNDPFSSAVKQNESRNNVLNKEDCKIDNLFVKFATKQDEITKPRGLFWWSMWPEYELATLFIELSTYILS